MSRVIVLQGPPASGKSTWRKSFIADNRTWGYVNADELRLANPDASEEFIRNRMYSNAHEYFQNGVSFIVDNTNLNPKTVARWRNLAAHYNYDFEIKQFLDVTLSDCIRRDSMRPNPVGKSVIWKMYIDAGLEPYRGVKLKLPAIIIDLDGTLCDTSNRQHFVLNKPKDWKSFFAGIPDDKPNSPVAYLYQMAVSIAIGPSILFVSGRDSKYRKVTEDWLARHDFAGYDLLLMRNFDDRRDDSIVKQEIYTKYIAPYYDVKFVVDDRNRVVNMWRSIGVPCFQCAEGDF